MRRRVNRELIFKALFAYEIEKGDAFVQLAYIAGDWEMAGYANGEPAKGMPAVDSAYSKRLLSGITGNQATLDALISDYAVDWGIERLGGAERNILRISLYEMLYDEKLPPEIAINEAVDLMKKYGDPEGARFVNGILGRKADELKTNNINQ